MILITRLISCSYSKTTSGLEDPKDFLQDLVLQFWGRNMMQHGERNQPENSASLKGMSVASPSTTRTPAATREFSASANFGSSSRAETPDRHPQEVRRQT